MGTTFVPGAASMSVIDFLRQELEWEHAKIIDHSIKGNTAYLAFESNKDGNHEVFGCVVELHKYRDERGYKPVTECMGPLQCECPLRILNLLTPTDSQWANEWRAKCRANATTRKPRLKVGQKIRFDRPIKFTHAIYGEFEQQVFTVEQHLHCGRKQTAYRGEDGRLYRIRGVNNRTFTIEG